MQTWCVNTYQQKAGPSCQKVAMLERFVCHSQQFLTLSVYIFCAAWVILPMNQNPTKKTQTAPVNPCKLPAFRPSGLWVGRVWWDLPLHLHQKWLGGRRATRPTGNLT